MTTTIQTFRDGVGGLLQDDGARLSPGEIDQAIRRGVRQYSKDRPLEKVADTSGNGTAMYPIFNDWSDGFSRILQIEHPIGNEPPTFLEEDRFFLYRSPSGLELRFDGVQPSISESFRTTYTLPHKVDETTSTVYGADEEAVIFLAASYGCRMLATLFAHTSDPSLDADVTDYEGKSEFFADRANDYQKHYREHIGKGADVAVRPFNVNHDQDVDYQWGGDKLFHPRRLR
jgi:hypothetical protein